jgi:hypothetical protein
MIVPRRTISTGVSEEEYSQADPSRFGPGALDANQEPRFLEQVKLFFDRASKHTKIPNKYLNLIKACNAVVRFNIPLKRDNGDIETITCYRYTYKSFNFVLVLSIVITSYHAKEVQGMLKI